MVLHEQEWVVIKVTKELDFGLYTPIVFVILEKFMFVEKPRIEATHIPI
jgi:hypothetical protein